jgi:hypothetical protein
MASKENLRPQPIKDHNEAVTKGRAGGIKSGVTRRRNRDMKQMARLILNLDAPDKVKEALTKLGLDAGDATINAQLMASMVEQATNGNVDAAKFLRDTAGYNPYEQERLKIERDKARTAKQKAIGEFDISPDIDGAGENESE